MVDVNGRAIRLRAQIPNADNALKPGPVRAGDHHHRARARSALLVPESAVIPHGAGKAVYVVENGKARLHPGQTGKRLPGKVEIAEGLEAQACRS